MKKTFKLENKKASMILLLSSIIILFLFFHFKYNITNIKSIKTYIYLDGFNDNCSKSINDSIYAKGWGITQYGWGLAPSKSGVLIYEFSNLSEDTETHIRLWFYSTEKLDNSLGVSIDRGLTYNLISKNKNYKEEQIDITPYIKKNDSFRLKFSATNRGKKPIVVIDKMHLTLARRKEVDYLTSFLWFVFLPLISFFILQYFNVNKKKAFIISLILIPIIILISLVFSSKLLTKISMFSYLFFMLIILSIYMNLRLKNKEHKLEFNKKLLIFLFIGILLLAFSLRLDHLVTSPNPLDPDVGSYRNAPIQKSFLNFYDASSREPLWPFVYKIVFSVFGESDMIIRIITIFFSILIVSLTFKVGKEFANDFVGLFAAFLVAINPFLIFNSIRGLKMEIFTCLLLLMFYYLFIREMNLKKRLITVGILGGLACLLRLESLVIVFFVLGYFIIKNIIRKPQDYKKITIWTACGILITLIMVGPFMYNCYKEKGDPFFPLTKHTVAWRNIEFKGQEGFLTVEEVRANLYTGKKVTGAEYVFKMHTPKQIAKYITKGYYDSFNKHIKLSGTRNPPYDKKIRFIFWFGLLGILLLLFLRKFDIIVMMSISIFPNVFTVYLGASSRHVMHIYPFFAIITAWFIYYVLVNIPETRTIYERFKKSPRLKNLKK